MDKSLTINFTASMLFKIQYKKHKGENLNSPNVFKNLLLKILTFRKLKLGLFPRTLYFDFEELMQYFYELK